MKRLVGGVLLVVLGLASSWVHDACFDDEERRRPAPHATDPAELRARTGEVVPGLVLVDFEDGTSAARVDELETGTGVDLSFNSAQGVRTGITLGALGDPADDEAQLAALRALPGVESVEPVQVYRASMTPDDPDAHLQWHLQQIRMEEAWERADGSGVIVAILDTGIASEERDGRARAPDLGATRFAPGWDFVDDDATPLDGHGHGTHVAGTVAQSTNNGLGVAGVAWAATLLPVKVLADDGGGTSADIADGIRFAADQGARVINLSLGGGGYSDAMARAVRYAREKGAVVVCAAGNAGRSVVEFPAAYPGAIAVSAVRFDGELAPYSSYGAELDLAAPGGDKSVDQNGDGFPDGVLQNTIARGDPSRTVYDWYQGTSMATPHVSGVAALLVSAGARTPDEVEAALFGGARDRGAPGWDTRFGHGLLDAEGALAALGKGGGSRGLSRSMAVALVVFAAAMSLGRRRGPVSLIFVAGLVVAGCGLFVLPWLGVKLPFAAVLASPLAEWPAAWFGGGAPSPFWYSAGPPLTLAFVLFGVRRGRELSAGVALGTAALLGGLVLAGGLELAWLPWRGLVLAWLGGNALLCFGIGRALWARGGST